MSCNQQKVCKCCVIPCETQLPCNPCYIIKCQTNTVCKQRQKPKKGEPECGCVYGCPCKAACYDWNPCVRPFEN